MPGSSTARGHRAWGQRVNVAETGGPVSHTVQRKMALVIPEMSSGPTAPVGHTQKSVNFLDIGQGDRPGQVRSWDI